MTSPASDAANTERNRVYRLRQTVTETYLYDPEQIRSDFAEALDGWHGSFEDFVIETFEQHDGSRFMEHWFYNDANPQVGVELEEGWDDD